MANNKKFVVKNGLTTSNIEFKDDINNGTNTITMSMLSTDVLSFSGDSGQLFSISDSLTGTIFSVNDISGIPSVEVDDDGTIRLAEFAGNILVGSNTDNGSDKLQVTGNTSVNGTIKATDFTIGTSGKLTSNNYVQTQLGTKLNSSSYTASDVLTKIKTVDGSGSGLDADTLDGLNSTSFSSNNYVQSQLGTKLNSSSYTALDVLTKIKTVDGAGSGLDADTLDGLQGSSYSSNNYITDHYTSNNYIQTYVAAQVASVVDSAPAALDTLNELAAALGDDANFSTTVSNQIGIRSTNTYVNSTFSSNNYLQGQLGTKLNSSSYTASDVLTKIKTVDGSGSGLDADLLDGQHASAFQTVAAPNSPSITSTTVVNETIELVFGQSSTSGVTRYEVWSDGATGSDYSLISIIPSQDAAASMSVIDSSFDTDGTVAYRVYAVKNGVYSTAATTTKSFTIPSLDVSNMSVVSDITTFHVQYDLPDTRFMDHIEIYKDAETTLGALSRTGAALVYSGSSDNFTYTIPTADLDKFHQFWVEVVSV